MDQNVFGCYCRPQRSENFFFLGAKGQFASRMCKHHSEWYSQLLDYRVVFTVIQFINANAGRVTQLGGRQDGHSCFKKFQNFRINTRIKGEYAAIVRAITRCITELLTHEQIRTFIHSYIHINMNSYIYTYIMHTYIYTYIMHTHIYTYIMHTYIYT